MLARYAQRARELVPRPLEDSFFLTDRGTRPALATMEWNYGKACELACVQRSLDGRPRLHDLRHRFAVRNLERWYRRGERVDTHLETLATFLGHTHPNHTYWYLSATPELLRLASRRRSNR